MEEFRREQGLWDLLGRWRSRMDGLSRLCQEEGLRRGEGANEILLAVWRSRRKGYEECARELEEALKP